MSEYRVGNCILDHAPMISTALVSCQESGYFCYCKDYGWTIIVVIVVLVLSFLVCFLRYRKIRNRAKANEAHHPITEQTVYPNPNQPGYPYPNQPAYQPAYPTPHQPAYTGPNPPTYPSTTQAV